MRRKYYKNNRFLPQKFRLSLENIFSKDTSYNPSKYEESDVISFGHCYVVSKLVENIFNTNEFYIVTKENITHWFYNINGILYDFTSDQYGGDGIYPLPGDIKNKKRQNLMPQDSERTEKFIDRFKEQL